MRHYYIQTKLNSFWRKNGEEIAAFFTRQRPYFLTSKDTKKTGKELPVFCFHSVEQTYFENQLKYLKNNNYHTIASDELFHILGGDIPIPDKTVVLTFDDARGSFWATAFPLLKMYGMKAILFVAPGLVPETTMLYPNLEDVWAGKSPVDPIIIREQIQPVCTWQEIRIMHESGSVDIQSHSLTHSRINISPRVVDFVHPNFDSCFYDNVNIPITRNQKRERPTRIFRLGMPVYHSASRISDKLRFFEDQAITEELILFVEQNGGKNFFTNSSWRGVLEKKVRIMEKNMANTGYESQKDLEDAIRFELVQSKYLLESMLSNKKVEHFCYPWFQGSPLTDRIARESGYKALFYGLIPLSKHKVPSMAIKIRRISEEYIFCLPGKDRSSYWSILSEKLKKKMSVDR